MFDENVAAQGAISSGLQYNSAIANANLSTAPGAIEGGRVFRAAPRLYVEIDKVSNGFVLKCKDDVLIAKDLEELQGLFTAQVAAMLLEESK
jgi:hypothetical protein